MVIRHFLPKDEACVVALWETCGLTRSWNMPTKDIARKLAVQADLFFVGEIQPSHADAASKIVSTVMAGYDGHRGWIYYLAVDPAFGRQGLGKQMVTHAEQQLLARGCPKINLQIRRDNQDVIGFYESIGYSQDDVVSMGKRLVPDQ